MASRAFLTTMDNPFDPYEEFDSWYRFDIDKGYNSCALLARYVNVEAGASEPEIAQATEKGIDRIVLNDPLDLYIKVKKDVEVEY